MAEELNEEQAQQLWDEMAAGEQPAAGSDPQEAPLEEPKTDEPRTEEQPAEPAAAGEQEPSNAPVDDEPQWAKALRESISTIETRLRKTEGHIGGLTSESKRLAEQVAAAQAAAAQARAQGDSAPTAKQITDAAKTPEKWASFKDEFPDLAEAIDEKLGLLAPPTVDLTALRTEIKAELEAEYGKRYAEIEAHTEGRLVDVAHRGWRDLVKTEDFQSWLTGADESVRSLSQSPRADDAIELLNQYKARASKAAEASRVKAERQQRLASAAQIVRGEVLPPKKSELDMTAEELWEFENEKHLKAQRNG